MAQVKMHKYGVNSPCLDSFRGGANGAVFLGRGIDRIQSHTGPSSFFQSRKKKKPRPLPPKAVYLPGLSPVVSPDLKVPTQTPSNTSAVGPTSQSPALSPYLSFLLRPHCTLGQAWRPVLQAYLMARPLSPAPSLPVTSHRFMLLQGSWLL